VGGDTSIRNTSTGEDVPLNGPLVTPVPVDLDAGKYEITFSNPSTGKSVRRTVSVAANREQFVNVTFVDAASATLPAFTGESQ